MRDNTTSVLTYLVCVCARAAIRNCAANSSHTADAKASRAMVFPVIDGEGVKLYPVDWGHVIAALKAMSKFDGTIRPCSLTEVAVHLTATTKMSVPHLTAVANFRVVDYMRSLHQEDKRSDAAHHTYQSDPTGTIEFLSSLAELVTIFRGTDGGYTFKSATDKRFQYGTEILQQYRVTTKLIEEWWPTREATFVRHTLRQQQLFISPQSLHGLDVALRSFQGMLKQVLEICPSLKQTGMRWPSTGEFLDLPMMCIHTG